MTSRLVIFLVLVLTSLHSNNAFADYEYRVAVIWKPVGKGYYSTEVLYPAFNTRQQCEARLIAEYGANSNELQTENGILFVTENANGYLYRTYKCVQILN